MRPASMSEFLSLPDAVSRLVHAGDTVALEGFTHLIPFAAGHEIIRQRLTDLTLIRMTPDLLYDQMIGAGCASQARVLVGRQSRRGLAASTTRRGGEGLAACRSRSRSTVIPRWRTPTPRAPPACRRRSSAATRIGAAEGQSAHQVRPVPVHRRDARRGAGAPAGRRRHPRAEGRPRRQRAHRGHRRRPEGGRPRRDARRS